MAASLRCLRAISLDWSDDEVELSDDKVDSTLVGQPPSPPVTTSSSGAAQASAAAQRNADSDVKLMPPPENPPKKKQKLPAAEDCAVSASSMLDLADAAESSGASMMGWADSASESPMPGSCMPMEGESGANVQAVRLMDFVYMNAVPMQPSRIIDYRDVAQHCFSTFVDRARGEPIIEDYLLPEGKPYNDQLDHCLSFIKAMRRRKFYIGMTHCSKWRWGNCDYGHKWNREPRWSDMVLLLHVPLQWAHPIEKDVCSQVFTGTLKDLQHLIHNKPNTAKGSQVADEYGMSWIYVLRGPFA